MYTVTVTAEFSVTGNFFVLFLCIIARPCVGGLIAEVELSLPTHSYVFDSTFSIQQFCRADLARYKRMWSAEMGLHHRAKKNCLFFAWMLTERWHWPLLSLFSWKLCCKNSSKTLINRRSACLWYKVFKSKDTSRFKAFPTCAFEWNNKM